MADPVQLEQVLFNLCLNARDAMRDTGTLRLRIGHSAAAGHCASCSARLEDTPWVWVEVADDGCGMPPDVIERMFEPFFTTKEVGRGTGMGLAMVHGIVHDHGGHILVESAVGRGRCSGCCCLPPPRTRGRVDAVATPPTVAGAPAASLARPRAAGRRRGHRQRLHGGPDDRMGTRGGAGARSARRGAAAGAERGSVRPAAHRPDHARHDGPRAIARWPVQQRPACRCCCTPATHRKSTRTNWRPAACARCCASRSKAPRCARCCANCWRIDVAAAYERDTKMRAR